MLDNPQSKLNQQASQNTNGLNSQTGQPAPISTKPDGTRATPDMQPRLDSPEVARLKDPSGQQPDIVNPEEGPGFFAKLKGKIANQAKERVTAKLSSTGPTQKSTDSKAPASQPAPNTPKASQPAPNTPTPTRPNPNFKAPSVPRPQMPKIPKLR